MRLSECRATSPSQREGVRLGSWWHNVAHNWCDRKSLFPLCFFLGTASYDIIKNTYILLWTRVVDMAWHQPRDSWGWTWRLLSLLPVFYHQLWYRSLLACFLVKALHRINGVESRKSDNCFVFFPFKSAAEAQIFITTVQVEALKGLNCALWRIRD